MTKFVAYLVVAAAILGTAFTAINAAETLQKEVKNRKATIDQF